MPTVLEYDAMQPDGSITYLFSGYARLPHDVSRQPASMRVAVVLEVDERGIVVDASCTLVTDLARDFFARLVRGRSVLAERQQIEAAVRDRYRGHSQGALIFALRRVFEAVDQSPVAQCAGREDATGVLK